MTRVLETAQLRTIFIAVLFTAMAFFAFASNASANLSGNGSNYESHDIKGSGGHADSKGNWTSGGGERGGGGNSPTGYNGSGITDGPGGGSYGEKTNAACRTVPTNTGGSTVWCDKSDKNGNGRNLTEDQLKNLENKLKELDEKKIELLRMMDALKNRASSTPGSTSGNSGDWKGRFCSSSSNTGGGIGLSGDLKKRICDRWDNHATSTPNTPKPPRATTTPMVQVISPNGGTAMKARLGGAVAITWKNTTTDRKVDIDLKKNGSTTVSIAKDVNGNRSNMSSGPSGRGGDKSDRNTYEYRWKRAPIGEGYKIVITANVGSTTYSDESDSAFSVKKASKGHESNSSGGGGGNSLSSSGGVLGASTSREDEVFASFAALEDSLAEMSVQLSSL